MSLKDKYDAVVALINEHNSAIGKPEDPGFVNPDDFCSCIKAAGGTNDERLRELSYEDILQCLPTFTTNGNKVQPRALAKQIAKIFRGKEESSSEGDAPSYVSPKKVKAMNHRQLVEAFNPEEPDSPVAKRLLEISKGKPFIVYDHGRTVHVDATVKLLGELRDYDPRTSYEVGGEIKEVYGIGYLPDNYAEENPLYPNRPLRPNGDCDQLNRSWEGVPLEVRQMVRLVLTVEGLDITGADGRERAHSLLDMALKPDALAVLKRRYTNAALKFNRLQKESKLPTLRIALGQQVSLAKGGTKNPFESGRRVTWKTKGLVAHTDPKVQQMIYQARLAKDASSYMYDPNLKCWRDRQ